MSESPINLEKEKVNLETSLIPWSELQRFFAGGRAIFVAQELDLVEVAYQLSKDNKTLVQQWLENNQIGHVSDKQAREWFEKASEVWAVVVKPWVLVQEQAAKP
ncbi:DUF2288 domain-containing protein [Methylomarinum vadi]|uniref:DUF2288 domain-containing protein n=1 Tax=Methylomarinum vadi TaxID=438855 RepID=UPI0004DED333|nr:DUF2288 domain-containing protein [Methylomarinum vadi]